MSEPRVDLRLRFKVAGLTGQSSARFYGLTPHYYAGARSTGVVISPLSSCWRMIMNVGHVCQHKVITIGPGEDLATAARLMREKHIGYLVVVEPGAQEGLVPVGVLTDRDIVVSVIAEDADPHALCVGDVMTRNPVVVLLEDTVPDALQEMRRIGVRRLPVVGPYGNLHGILSLDDILIRMANDLDGAAGAIRKERAVESASRP